MVKPLITREPTSEDELKNLIAGTIEDQCNLDFDIKIKLKMSHLYQILNRSNTIRAISQEELEKILFDTFRKQFTKIIGENTSNFPCHVEDFHVNGKYFTFRIKATLRH